MCMRALLQPAKPIIPCGQPFDGSTGWSDRPATPASGKSLLHDVNEPDTDDYPRRNLFWTRTVFRRLFPRLLHSLDECALVEPDGIEPTTSSLQS